MGEEEEEGEAVRPYFEYWACGLMLWRHLRQAGWRVTKNSVIPVQKQRHISNKNIKIKLLNSHTIAIVNGLGG
jgi:hypothetical protein